MKSKNKLESALIIFISFLMTQVPNVASAEFSNEKIKKMISTQDVVQKMTRSQAVNKILTQLERKDLQGELIKYGVSADEAKMRLASLSDSELSQIATQMERAQYAGTSVTGLLVVVVLVLLIVYLAKRI